MWGRRESAIAELEDRLWWRELKKERPRDRRRMEIEDTGASYTVLPQQWALTNSVQREVEAARNRVVQQRAMQARMGKRAKSYSKVEDAETPKDAHFEEDIDLSDLTSEPLNSNATNSAESPSVASKSPSVKSPSIAPGAERRSGVLQASCLPWGSSERLSRRASLRSSRGWKSFGNDAPNAASQGK